MAEVRKLLECSNSHGLMDCCQNLNINFETVYKNGGFAAETRVYIVIE